MRPLHVGRLQYNCGGMLRLWRTRRAPYATGVPWCVVVIALRCCRRSADVRASLHGTDELLEERKFIEGLVDECPRHAMQCSMPCHTHVQQGATHRRGGEAVPKASPRARTHACAHKFHVRTRTTQSLACTLARTLALALHRTAPHARACTRARTHSQAPHAHAHAPHAHALTLAPHRTHAYAHARARTRTHAHAHRTLAPHAQAHPATGAVRCSTAAK